MFFVTAGADPQAIFLGASNFGDSFRAKESSGWEGAIIGDVEIEIDMASMASRHEVGMPSGGIIVTQEGVHIFAKAKAGMGFRDTYAWNIMTGEGAGYINDGIVFTRWRVCKRAGNDTVELLSIDVTPSN